MSNHVTLVVGGREYGGWKAISISAGIDRMARDFSLAVTDKWPGSGIQRRIMPHDACQVFIGADLVLTGWVDGTPINYDDRQISVGINGRSKTCDLVDCSATNSPGQWKKAKLERIVADLVKPFGIKVVTEVDTGDPIANHQLERGETVQESIDRLINQRALLATDDAAGNLVLTRAGTKRATDIIRTGGNVKAASAELDFKDCFSEYRVIGQRQGTDDDFGKPAASPAATAKDPNVPRFRPLLIQMDGAATPKSAKERANWEGAYRRGKGFAVTYTLQNWRQSTGGLWLHNQMVMVQDSIVGYAADMLIPEITYEISDSGTIATIKVMPKSAYEQKPDIAKSKSKKSSSGSSSVAGGGENVVSFDEFPDETGGGW